MKMICFIAVMLILTKQPVCAQTNEVKLNRVKIGEKVPAYPLNHILNFPQNHVNLNGFDNKILILDFWTFGCLSCIESWPKLMKLQEEFKNDIQIITVNIYEDQEKIKKFLDNRDQIFGTKMSLPVACGDKKLKELFPHSSVPHVIYIDRDKKVKYISDGNYLNRETIQNMIAKKAMLIPEKTDNYTQVDWSKPLFVDGNGGAEENGGKILWSTMIKNYNPNMAGTTQFASSPKGSVGVLANMTIKDMFRLLYGRGMNPDGTQLWVPSPRTIFNTRDTSKYVLLINGIIAPQNFYTIQLTAQKEIPLAQIQRKMATDLQDYFGLEVKWEKQKKKCLVISRSTFPIQTYHTGKRLLQINTSILNANDVTIQEIIDRLFAVMSAYYKFPYPIVDESGFQGKLGDINIETNVGDFNALGAALNKYGLTFSLQNRMVDVLVISDRD